MPVKPRVLDDKLRPFKTGHRVGVGVTDSVVLRAGVKKKVTSLSIDVDRDDREATDCDSFVDVAALDVGVHLFHAAKQPLIRELYFRDGEVENFLLKDINTKKGFATPKYLCNEMSKQHQKQPYSPPRLDDYDGRKPPQAIDIEEAVLGAMLLESDIVTDLLCQLTVDSFYKRPHQLIFAAMAELAQGSNPVDILTVSDELARRGELDEAGGTAYLSQLSTKIGSAAHVAYHARVLQQKYLQREMITIAYGVLHDAFEGEVSVEELIDTAQDRIFQLEEHGARSEVLPIKAALSQTLDRIEANQAREDGLSGLPSGYVGIDRMTFGWQPGDLVIIAARPSVGKTAFALTMARNMAVDHHIPVAFFSTEMSGEQLMTRLLVSEAGLPAEKLRGAKKMSQQEWQRLNEAVGRLEKAPVSIDITGSISVHEFRAKARRLVSRDHVKVLIVDYLQHMSGPPGVQNREQEVASISRILKDIAIELNVPVIALSQLNRDMEKRGGDKRPQLSDLRDSGSIEQDADIVMFLHRPEYYGLADANSVSGETNVIFAKHRNGEVGEVQMRFLQSECRFVDYNEPYPCGLQNPAINYVPSRMNQ